MFGTVASVEEIWCLDAYVSGTWAEAQNVFLTSEIVLAGQTPA